MPKGSIGDRALGMRLRRFRERAGVSLEYVAEVIDWSASKLSRFERGQTPEVTSEEVSAILGVLRVHGHERAETLKMLTSKADQGVWEDHDADLTDQTRTYLALEPKATRLIFVQPFLVPGLLQTSEYCRILFQTFGLDQARLHGRMARRLGRQEILSRRNPPDVLFIVNEHTLRQPFGTHLLMAQQVRRIIEEAARPHVSVRVVPETVVAHPGLFGGFAILEFADEPSIVYIEGRMSGLFPENPKEVADYILAAKGQADLALDEHGSLELMHVVVEYLERAR